MNPTDDLLTTLATNRWRLDMDRRGVSFGNYRCMWWCAECGVWRCVVESGEWFPTPHEAIRAAVQANEKPD